MKNMIRIKTETETVLINKDHIVSIEIYEKKETMDCDGEMLEADFFEVRIVTTKSIYIDQTLYSEIDEIEYLK